MNVALVRIQVRPRAVRSLTAACSRVAQVGLCAGALAFGGLARGQATVTPDNSEAPSGKSETVNLQPFEVISDKSDSYQALNTSSLSGTNRSLDKLPITAEIYNSTLMSDLAITDVTNLLNSFATGIVAGEASPGSSAASGALDGDRFNLSGFGVRGLNVGALRRNGFLEANNLSDTFEIDRTEIIRGPQSLLYGTNPAGGVINVVTKKAIFGSNFRRAQVQVDDIATRRYSLDANVAGKIMNRRAAVRVAALDTDQGFWRDLVKRRTWGAFGEAAVELIPASQTTLRYEWEQRQGRTDAEPRAQTRITGAPGLVPNNTVLALMVARNDPALAQIANGGLRWENIDELFGYSNATKRRERYQTVTLSSKLTSWLSGQVIASQQATVLDRVSPGAATALTAPLTGSNPLNAWAVGYSPSAAHNGGLAQGLRALLTAEFDATRFTKNSLVLGAERKLARDGYNFAYSYDQVDANGNFVVNPAQLNTANGGRTAMPIQWVDVTTKMKGYVDLDQQSYIVNGVKYVRHDQKAANPAFASPGNPLGFNGGSASATIVNQAGNGMFGALFSTWFGGKVETMLGARYDTIFVNNVNTGSVVDANGATGNAGFVYNVTKPVSIYGGASSNFRPGSTNGSAGPDGKLLPNGRGKSWEGGFKVNAFEGRLSGSIGYYSTTSVNEAQAISTTTRAIVDPTGINGSFYSGLTNPSINYDRKTKGVEVTLTGKPLPNLRVQLGYSHNIGREGRAVFLPYHYNDEFRTNTAGTVLLADGSPLLVPISTSTPIASDGKTYAAGVATEAMTVAILKNGDANGNYKASVAADSGRIQNAAAVGLSVSGVGTGRLGLPIAQHQLGFVPVGGVDVFQERFGGDPSPGYPTDAFTFTSMYAITSGWFKGVSLGFNSTVNTNMLLYFYTDTAAGNVRRKKYAPDKAVLNLIAGYDLKLTKRVGFKTQLNVNNVFDKRDLTYYPNAATGVLDNAVLRTDPLRVVWTNTFSF